AQFIGLASEEKDHSGDTPSLRGFSPGKGVRWNLFEIRRKTVNGGHRLDERGDPILTLVWHRTQSQRLRDFPSARFQAERTRFVMDAAANYPQRAIKVGPLFPAVRVASVGTACCWAYSAPSALSLLCSPQSPRMTTISNKSFVKVVSQKQCVLANYKTVSNPAFQICTVRSALAPPTPHFASH